MSAPSSAHVGEAKTIDVEKVQPNAKNPRLIFPPEELARLADSIEQEGILVPITVYAEGDDFVLVDGERRYKCAKELGLKQVPAMVVEKRDESQVLLQMFNIHEMRERWRDMPTALALGRVAEDLEESNGETPSDKLLAEITGLSIERVKRYRFAGSLPKEWQDLIEAETIPLNYFWELKRNLIDPLSKNRSALFEEFGRDGIISAFVEKRHAGVVPDTVGLRQLAPIVAFAASDAKANDGTTDIDDEIRRLITETETTIGEVFEDTVGLTLELARLEKRTKSITRAFQRLVDSTVEPGDRAELKRIGDDFVSDLNSVMSSI